MIGVRESGFLCLFSSGRCWLVGWFEATYAEVVNDFLNLFHVVLESIEAFSEMIVFQIQQPESGVEFVDESSDLDRAVVIAASHTVHSEATLKEICSVKRFFHSH